MNLTIEQIKALQELEKKATKGEWVAHNVNRGNIIHNDETFVLHVHTGEQESGYANVRFVDTDLIVALRNAAPSLLALALDGIKAGAMREALERIETTDHLDTCDYIRSFSRGVPCNCHIAIARAALSPEQGGKENHEH